MYVLTHWQWQPSKLTKETETSCFLIITLTAATQAVSSEPAMTTSTESSVKSTTMQCTKAYEYDCCQDFTNVSIVSDNTRMFHLGLKWRVAWVGSKSKVSNRRFASHFDGTIRLVHIIDMHFERNLLPFELMRLFISEWSGGNRQKGDRLPKYQREQNVVDSRFSRNG